jgi:K+-transporting ATPase c subunit
MGRQALLETLYALSILACTVMLPVATMAVALLLFAAQAMGSGRRTATPAQQLAVRFAGL